MPGFALKAAVIDYDQIAARAGYMASVGLPVRLELHTFGGRDIDVDESWKRAHANVTQLRDRFAVGSLVVHVPLQSVSVVTTLDFDEGQCIRSIDFAQAIGADAVVLHRYYGLVYGQNPPRFQDKTEAERAFEHIVADLAKQAAGLPLLIENVGHYSLLPRDGKSFLTGPLDHFFPWEIRRFRDFVAAAGLKSVFPFVDVAHATLSANLFNRRRAQPELTRSDPRFAWITDDDLDQAEWLDPFDFVDSAMPYLHVSDAFQLPSGDCQSLMLDEQTLTTSIVSEGLEIGTGTLPFDALPACFGDRGTLVLEVDPSPGETHIANGAQLRSLDILRAIFDRTPTN
jgi:hypothetical protein